jgi:FkbM family methyltransferase
LNVTRRFYGQRGEDRVAWEYFRRFSEIQLNRTFLDIGSYDGRHLSNTLFFEEQGWRGICVEANPAVFEALARNRKCVCVNVACSDHEGSVEFFCQENRPMGTTSASAAEKLRASWNFQPSPRQLIPARTVDSLLREHGMEQVDFVSIDVDGGEVDVLKGFNLAHAKPKLICIETNLRQVESGLWPREHVDEINRILRGYGFHPLKNHGANTFYSKDRYS